VAGIADAPGMTPSGTAEIRAAMEGGAALERYLAAHEFDPEQFTPADEASPGRLPQAAGLGER